MTAYTQRVEVGAFYSDGERLVEVAEVHDLGYITVHDAMNDDTFGRGISAFRREFWLVRTPTSGPSGQEQRP